MARKPRVEYEITAEDKSAAELRKAERGLQDLTSVAKTAALGIASVVGLDSIGRVAQLADQYNQLNTRIRTATKDTGDFTRVQSALLSMSLATGAAFEDTVSTFQALSRVREDIGATNDQMLVLTQTVQQLGVIGGSSSDAMRNGLLQFNQAIAGGVFRAEEFNSIVENMPELAKRIADGFGLTQGELRAMVLDGKLFSDDVINTLLQQAPEISKEFEEIPSNLGMAFNALATSIGSTASELDRAVGITTTLAEKIQGAATALNIWQKNFRLADIAAEIRQLGDVLQGEVPKTLGQRIMNAIGLGEDAVASGLLPGAEERIRKRMDELIAERDALLGRVGGDVGQVTGGAAPAAVAPDAEFSKSVANQARKHFEDQIKAEVDLNKQRIELRIRSEQEFAKAVLEEDARLHEERVAQALGFETIEAQEAFAREAELFAARMEARAAQFQEELAIELGYKDARDQALQEMEQAHQDAMIAARYRGNALAQKAMMDLRKFEEAQGAQKVNVLLQQAMQLTAGLASNNKTIFNLNKALSIGSAIMNTAEGVTKELSRANYAGAALIGAMGAAQIATIASTQFGGASSGYTGGGPGSGIPSMSNAMFEPPTVSASERNSGTIRIEIVGGNDSEIARAMIKSARVVMDEEDDIFASGRSRQALEFAS